MFVWDFSAAFAVILIVLLGIVFGLWIAYTLSKKYLWVQELNDAQYFRQCRFCGYVYRDYFKRNPFRCPQCLSYHDIV
jgi:hypothetical protein